MPEQPSLFSIPENKIFPQCWAGLAVLALMLSGLAPLLLIAGRASIYAEMEFVKAWFVPVLVVHVNLSVGLWFLAIAMMLWSYAISRPRLKKIHKFANFSFFLAILCLAFSPVFGGDAFTSNYIPVQDNSLFFSGLLLAAFSMAVMIGCVFASCEKTTLYTYLIRCNAATAGVALLCFIFSILQHPSGYSGEAYYEVIFWGGGHLLQFVYVQLAMIAWLWIYDHLGAPAMPARLIKTLFILLTITAAISPVIYLLVDINSYYHIKFFTWQMNVVTGTVPALLLVLLLARLPKLHWRRHKPAAIALIMSFALYLEGGLLGFLIEGSNVTIPAHYHGSTVGVTLALMGLLYLLLERWDYASLAHSRLALAQPILYGIGQIMHATGLAWAGSHNIARKTAGALSEADQAAEVALQVMRLGGLLAVLGGGLFIIVMLRAFFRHRRAGQ
jgi:hypothetical protein